MNNIGIRKAYGQNRSYVFRDYRTIVVKTDREYLSFDRFWAQEETTFHTEWMIQTLLWQLHLTKIDWIQNLLTQVQLIIIIFDVFVDSEIKKPKTLDNDLNRNKKHVRKE